MAKKLTIQQLLAQKEELKRERQETKAMEIYVEEMDTTVVIEEPSHALVRETVEMGQDENFDGNADAYLVYNIMTEPNLKDPTLQKEFECVEPTDIVEMIFDRGTISGIAKLAMDLSGYTSGVKAVKQLKN